MARSATVKDVLYALEFTGARLCMWPTYSAKPNAWSLEPGGIKVPAHVADQARAHSGIVGAPNGKFGEAVYVWREAA